MNFDLPIWWIIPTADVVVISDNLKTFFSWNQYLIITCIFVEKKSLYEISREFKSINDLVGCENVDFTEFSAKNNDEQQEFLYHSSCGITRNSLNWKNISWNQPFSKFSSENIAFTKFLSKKRISVIFTLYNTAMKLKNFYNTGIFSLFFSWNQFAR